MIIAKLPRLGIARIGQMQLEVDRDIFAGLNRGGFGGDGGLQAIHHIAAVLAAQRGRKFDNREDFWSCRSGSDWMTTFAVGVASITAMTNLVNCRSACSTGPLSHFEEKLSFGVPTSKWS